MSFGGLARRGNGHWPSVACHPKLQRSAGWWER